VDGCPIIKRRCKLSDSPFAYCKLPIAHWHTAASIP